ncbi:MAG: GNAT family N-acetyltransferase, partial [Burkholderiales bacterium]|nr:GNAT family N-acetyltransferase [Burkholderiales bacterium]
MRETKVRTANEEERERVIAAIAAGFLADPVVRWCWPDSKQYLTCAPWFISAYGGRAFEHDSAWIDDAVQGGALWLPPGVGPDEEELGKLISTTMREEKQGAILAALEALGAHH